jgi:DNA-directed RNA polymerase subunit RPC12/RpoP
LEKVRFACPRCQTVMQTGSDRVGYDVACPHCSHRFKLIAPDAGKPVASGEGDSLRQSKTVGSDDATVSLAPGQSDSRPPLSGRNFQQTPDADRYIGIEKPDGVAKSGNYPPAYAVPMEAARNAPVGFCCPYCRSTRPPKLRSKVSTVGWVIFTVLLLTTCVLSPIGLLVREYYRIWSQCKIPLGGN